MNPWKISTFVLGLAVVGLLGLSVSNSGGEPLQGAFGGSALADVATAVDEVHDELGYSTWTLEAIGAAVNQTHDELGYSSWTLQDLAVQIANVCD